MKIRKDFLTFALLSLCFCCLLLPQTARADQGIMPLDLYVKMFDVKGNINVGTGQLSAEVTIKTLENCEIYTTVDIYKKVDGDWEFVRSFRNPRTGVYIGQSKTYSDSCKVDKGYDYKIVATAYVKSVADQVSEAISQESQILSYK